MKEYIAQLHTKSRTHKKRFAFLVSGGVTLVIFALWSAIVFRDKEPVVAKDNVGNLAGVAAETTAFDSIFDNIKTSWQSLTDLVTNG